MNGIFNLFSSIIGASFVTFVILIPYILLGLYIAYPPVNPYINYIGLSLLVLLIVILKPITILLKSTKATKKKIHNDLNN